MKKFALIFSVLISVNLMGTPCAFPSAPQVLVSAGDSDKAGSKLLQFWELEDSAVLWSTELPQSASLRKFRDSIRSAAIDVSPLELLRRALPFWTDDSPEHRNLELAIAQAPTSIRPILCIEALLLEEQTNRMDMTASPTEFVAYILEDSKSAEMRIYFYTVNQPGIGSLGAITDEVTTFLKGHSDWALRLNLHNHNFFLNENNIGGVPSPSGTDVGAFRELAQDLHLQEARITNGFDTIRLVSSDFWTFHASAR